MSERWKFQLKFGIFWGLFMGFCTIFFEGKQNAIQEELTSPKFYLRMSIYLLLGIFLLGYLSWKGKDPKNNKWSTFFGKKTKE